MNELEKNQYLKRINLDKCDPTLADLSQLQEHHMKNIPFENLDIIVGRKIELDFPHLYTKIITKKRGGYCFELNSLYAELLRSVGFMPQAVLGRVWISNPKNLPPRNHLAHLVKIEGKTYITDVGFGGLITRIPLDIDIHTPVKDSDGMVRITPLSEHQYMIERATDKGWTKQYSFEILSISDEDISIANYYMSTNINSHFYYHKFVGRNTTDGRIGLFNTKMSIRKGIKVIDKKQVDHGQDWLDTLKKDFGIELDFTESELSILFPIDQ